ncbi:MAG: phosphotransferase [Oscillospiraceae bacterium]|nr:phosphotransferase [Oscillospiraceae bacterium]
MLDLHCHILPGLDDGAPDEAVSLAMAAMAADSGVTHIFATPHCNTHSEQKNYRSASLIEAYRSLQRRIDEAGIPLKILAGAEVLARGSFFRRLAEGDFMTLNGSRYLLLEFYFDEAPDYMEECLSAVEAEGLVPVVAHPERYFCIQDRPDLAQVWAERGRVLQLNKGSLLGDLGERAYDTAALLLRREAVAAIASDAHHVRYRNPHMGPLLQCLEQRFPNADPVLLLRETPLRIAKDLSL